MVDPAGQCPIPGLLYLLNLLGLLCPRFSHSLEPTSLLAQMIKHLPTMWETREKDFNFWRDFWRRKWQPTPVLLPGKSHGWRSLVGYSPRGHKDLDTTKWLNFLSFNLQVTRWLKKKKKIGYSQWVPELYLGKGFKLGVGKTPKGFPGGSASKEFACSAGDANSIPGSGRSPGGGNGYPLQYSCLENSHGQRSLAGYNSWGCKASDLT